MFRFTIRDVLWLTVVVGVAMTGGMCNQRISHVIRVAKENYETERVARERAEIELLQLKAKLGN